MSLIFGIIIIFASALVALAAIGEVVAENNVLRATLAVAREDVLAARRVARREERIARRAMRRAEFAEAQERAAIRAEALLRMRVEALEARLRAAEALLDTAVEEAAETAGRLRSAEALLFLDEDEEDDVQPLWLGDGIRAVYAPGRAGLSERETAEMIDAVYARVDAGWWPEEDAPLRAAAS